MARPTDPLPQWQGTTQTPSTAKQTTGWTAQEKPPFQFFNWFWNIVSQYLAFVVDKTDNHVHDGGTADLSVAKIDLSDHIDYGTNGFLDIGTDTALIHEIVHSGTAAVKVFTTDIFNVGTVDTEIVNASQQVNTPLVETSGGTVNAGSLNVSASSIFTGSTNVFLGGLQVTSTQNASLGTILSNKASGTSGLDQIDVNAGGAGGSELVLAVDGSVGVSAYPGVGVRDAAGVNTPDVAVYRESLIKGFVHFEVDGTGASIVENNITSYNTSVITMLTNGTVSWGLASYTEGAPVLLEYYLKYDAQINGTSSGPIERITMGSLSNAGGVVTLRLSYYSDDANRRVSALDQAFLVANNYTLSLKIGII